MSHSCVLRMSYHFEDWYKWSWISKISHDSIVSLYMIILSSWSLHMERWKNAILCLMCCYNALFHIATMANVSLTYMAVCQNSVCATCFITWSTTIPRALGSFISLYIYSSFTNSFNPSGYLLGHPSGFSSILSIPSSFMSPFFKLFWFLILSNLLI